MPISKAPEEVKPTQKKVSEKKVQEFINKGGKPSDQAPIEVDSASTKSLKLIMASHEMEAIKTLRDKRPRSSRSRKISISVHDWVIEAIQEKIQREQKKYGVKLL